MSDNDKILEKLAVMAERIEAVEKQLARIFAELVALKDAATAKLIS